MKTKILVPFDFSDSAAAALAWAADLQATLKNNVPIHLMHVVSLFPPGDPVTAIEPLVPTNDEIAAIKGQLTAAAAKARAQVVIEVVTRTMGVGETIVAVADAIHADLIAMGTHGRTGLKRLMLGSEAVYVTRHARPPVMTMRAAKT